MTEKKFTRADGLTFTLIKDGRHSLIYEVRNDKGILIRHEVWQTMCGNNFEIDHDETRCFSGLSSALKHFELIENNY